MAATLGDLVVALGFDPSGLDAGASALENRLQQAGTRMFFLGSRISAAFSIPLGFAMDSIAAFGLKFDQAMTESLAIMDNVTPQIRAQMEATAKTISETTKFSSIDAAKAYYDLASAGLNAEQSIAALPTVAQFAQAGMMDLAKAGEYLAGAQSALGMRTGDAAKDMQTMARISDELTTINNKALGTIQDYASALTNKGGQAMRMYNVQLEQGIAVLGAFGQQHILGAAAGNLLYMFLRDLTGAAVKHADAFHQAGIEVFDSSGKLRNMADIVDNITAKFQPMNAEGRRAELQFLGLTSRSQQAINALIGMGDTIRGYTTDLTGAGGATEKVANNQMQSMQNQLAVMKNRFDNIKNTIFEGFVPAFNDYIRPLLEKAIEDFRVFANWLNSLDESTKGWVLRIGALAVALGPLITFIGGATLAIRALLGGVTLFASTMTAMFASPWVLGLALAIGGITVAYSQWNRTLAEVQGNSTNAGKSIQGLTDDFGHAKMTIDEANQKLAQTKGLLMDLGKPLTITGNPFGDQPGGGTPPGGGAPPDTSIAKKLQNILDRVSGKTALEEAATWAAAIDKLKGGIASLADADAQAALNIFDTALDRLQKRGEGLSATAAKYSEFWLALADINNLKGVHFGIPKSILSPGEEGFEAIADGLDKAFIKAFDKIAKMADTNPVREVIGKIGLTISKSDIAKMLPADDFQKQMDKITNQFGAMAVEMGRLGRNIGGTFGSLLIDFSQFAIEMQASGKAGKEFTTGLDLLNKGGKDVVPGLLNIAQAGMQVVGSFMAATNSASMTKNILGAMAVGGEFGAEIGGKIGGPIGAGIGAAIGAGVGAIAAIFKGRPEWAKVSDEVGQLMGVHISQKLAQSIVDNAKNFGGSIQASTIAALSSIINEAGGLTSSNYTQFIGTLHDTFSMVETHQMTLAQGTKNLDDNFQNFVKAGTDGLGFLDQKLVEIIKLNQQFGTDSKAIADYLTTQAESITNGFNLIATGGMKPLNDLFKQLQEAGQNLNNGLTGTVNPVDQEKYVTGLVQQMKDLEAQIDTINAKVAKGTATATDIQHLQDYTQKLAALKTEYGNLSDAQQQLGDKLSHDLQGGQEEFDRLGRLANIAFGAAIASGKSFLQALDAIGPGLDQLATAASNFGFTQSDAFGKLLNIRNFVQANKDLVGELDGVNQMMTGLQNSGLMTNDVFQDLGAEATSVFNRMKAQGLDNNSALLLMQPTLQRLWEEEEKFGYKADDATQALIDMAKQSGLVGEQNKSDSEKMVDGIKDLNKTLKDLVTALTGGVGGAFDSLSKKAGDVIGGIKGGLQDLSNTPVNINVNEHVNRDGDTGPALAEGGITTGPVHNATIGESGAEAIIPLSRLKDYLQPNTSVEGPYALQPVQMVVDGRVVARATLKYMPSELRRNGIFT